MVEETVVEEINYEAMAADQLMEHIGEAYKSKDMSLMKRLLSLHNKAEASEAKTKKDELDGKLQVVTAETLAEFTRLADKLVEAGKIDGGDGIWFAYDFGEKKEKGINPSLRLKKSARRTTTSTGATSTGSYVSHPDKSDAILAEDDGSGSTWGEHVMFAEAETRRIDKVEHEIPAGFTFNAAYKFSTNGGWRNTVRMALLKVSGRIPAKAE